MTKGQRIQVDWDYGTVKGVGRDFVYVRLDNGRCVFAQRVMYIGSLGSVNYWTAKKEKRAKKEGT